MNSKNKIKQIVGIVIVVSLFAVFLCGCTGNSVTTNGAVDSSKFLGTWTGNMEETSIFGFRENDAMGNMSNFRENDTNWNMTGSRQNLTGGNITELEFTVDTLYMTIMTGNVTQTISQTYTIEGNQLILSMQFTGERSDWTQPPSDGERPPFDGERPFGGEPPFNGEGPSRTRSYTYSFNEYYDVLYLNGSSFEKTR